YNEFARIKCARFKGNLMNEFIDQKEFSGPLYEQVNNAMNFAKMYIAKRGKVKGLQRVDTYAVPLDAIREAIINAVVHRDYNITGSDIKFAIFNNRIELTSPGILPKALEIEDIIEGRSEIRNRVIARFFKEIKFIEQWGTGIKKIINLCDKAKLKPPQFIESGMFIKVIIYFQKVKIGKQKTTSKATSKTTSKTTSKIIKLIKANPQITAFELAKKINITEEGVRYYLKKMKKQNLVARIGSSKSGYWQIVK
ncbi:winged helix-turn-helix transcriptional regulator, partial [candidate division WOR-3 bacterium]|nr:winged helix-turn-helix transcriptional regulator [candidate division WOR-3 bacterium]